jgi:hypothetical protein
MPEVSSAVLEEYGRIYGGSRSWIVHKMLSKI